MTAAERRETIERAATEVFAQRGYHGASINEIARRSGVTPPVVYDHFASKLELHRRLLERTRDELLTMWSEHVDRPGDAEGRLVAAMEAWAAYVEAHRYAARMFFQDSTGDVQARAIHREVQDQARVALGAILGREPGAEHLAGSAAAEPLEMAAEVIRAGLTGLAVWWDEHPHVPRAQIVAVAVNALWVGFERVRRGDVWLPAPAAEGATPAPSPPPRAGARRRTA
jgi:AcrR family transcriptional regulator